MPTKPSQAVIDPFRRLAWLVLFAIGMAFVEAAVVVYLRRIFCPDGLAFPLPALENMASGAGRLLAVELCREIATLIMLAAVAILTGQSRPQRWACFLLAFGVWDIFYYIFLKLTIDWPATIFDWDILFLIPWPWLGPVLAPVIISLVMIFCALLVYGRERQGHSFKLGTVSLLLLLAGTAVILFSFLRDRPAAFGQQPPQAYWYPLLAIGVVLWLIAFLRAFRRSGQEHARS
jgi:hypothetical protein